MRWYRSDTLDELPAPPAPFRADRLRELVDKLPRQQRHIIERHFFGGEPLAGVAVELNLEIRRARALRDQALEKLKKQVLKDHALRAVPAAMLAAVRSGGVPEPRDVAPAGDDA